MTETPTERAARAYYIREQFLRTGMDAEAANALWNDADTLRWRDMRIASMAAALAEYEAAKEEVSAGKRERALQAATCVMLDCIGDLVDAEEAHGMADEMTEAFERVMAEPEHTLREKACEDLDRMLANGCNPATAVDIFVEDAAEANAAQPRKEGA